MSSSARALKKFTIFPGLPAELQLKIWALALPGPRVFEIQMTQNHLGYQFSTESKPKMPAIRAVNKQARDEFFRIYVPITLNRPLNNRPVPSSLACCFFSPAKDTIYLVEVRDFPSAYAQASSWFLHPDVVRRVRHLAVQGETFICEGFDVRSPPYSLKTPVSTRKASILNGWVSTLPQLDTLKVVVGDDFSLAPELVVAISEFSRKPRGELELTKLTGGRLATRNCWSAEDQLVGWIQFLYDHSPTGANRPEVKVCQALRGGKLVMIDVVGLLEVTI